MSGGDEDEAVMTTIRVTVTVVVVEMVMLVGLVVVKTAVVWSW